MRLTPAYIQSQVESVEYTYSGTLTIATVLTKSGTKLVGHSACLDPANYNREIGEQIARKNAIEQLWALEGYVIAKLGLSDAPGELTDAPIGIAVLPDEDRPSFICHKWHQHFRSVSVICFPEPTAAADTAAKS